MSRGDFYRLAGHRISEIDGFNPSTVKPFTSEPVINSMMPFTTNVKSPRVSRLIGSVRIRRIGRTIAFHEEHTIVEWPGEPPELGDRAALRPGHVRTTFNLHDRVWLVEGASVVDRLPVTARGRSD